jgi:hypothetical protein
VTKRTALHLVPDKLRKEAKGKKRERELTTKWLHPLLRKAGWDPSRIDGNFRVHEELTGSNGRVDVALKVGRRIVCCIEVKDPSVEIDSFSLNQAVKYAASYYYPVNGILDPIMAICTNGRLAFVMDPSLANPTNSLQAKHIDLTTGKGLDEFVKLLGIRNLNRPDGSLPTLTCKRITDVREYASNTHKTFKKSIFAITRKFIDRRYSASRSVELTILVLLLAAARDNGIIPNNLILKCLENKDWEKLALHCNKLFGNVFVATEKEQRDLWDAYESTRNLNLRLDIVPVHFMGIIYQELLKKYLDNKTSYYTPEDMIELVFQEVQPTIEDKILDPTCGSGAFLVSAIEYVLRHRSHDERKLFALFDNVVGVDKDAVAVKISKVSLLCQFMRCVGEDYQRSGKSLPRPRIEEPKDFFDWQGGRYSLIVGNPPWESIDALDADRKKEMETFTCYQDKNDQLCYIVEKSIRQHLMPKGRFGFVIKQQALLGDKYKKFCEFLDRKVSKVFDYGSMKRFDNYAQTSIIVGSTNVASWDYCYVEPLDIALITNNTQQTRFAASFFITRGAQTGGANKVYLEYGKKYPKDGCVKVYPKTLQFGGRPKTLARIAFFSGEAPRRFLQWLHKNKGFKRKLERRKDVVRSVSEKHPRGRNPYAWRWNSVETKLEENILVTERNLTPGYDRFPIFISTQSECLPMDNQTVISPKDNDRGKILVLGALLLSKYFVPLARGCKLIPRRAGGIFLNPKTVSQRLVFPALKPKDKNKIIILMNRLTRIVATDADLAQIDAIFSNYFRMAKQENEFGQYAERTLSNFLHPEIAVDEAA